MKMRHLEIAQLSRYRDGGVQPKAAVVALAPTAENGFTTVTHLINQGM
ncbi:hypothetical protein [Duganella sp. LjRoot269]